MISDIKTCVLQDIYLMSIFNKQHIRRCKINSNKSTNWMDSRARCIKTQEDPASAMN